MNTFFSKLKWGQSLVEVLMAIGLMAILIPAFITGLTTARSGKAQQAQRIKAVGYLKEAQEAVRNVREIGWTTFPASGTFHPAVVSGAWSLAANADTTTDGFTRQIVISTAKRNDNDVIDPNGTFSDPSTRQIVITISWELPFHSSITDTSYFTRHDKIPFTWTTQNDFDATGNLKVNAVSYSPSGNAANVDGEMRLGAGGGGGDWCKPAQSITTVDLSRQGIPTAISASVGDAQNKIANSIVTGTGGNASGPTFAEVNVLGNSPPVATVEGVYNNNKGNGVFRQPGSNHGFIATTDHSAEIKILDVTAPATPPTTFNQVGYFDAPGQVNGKSVFVLGNVGYMTTDSNDNKFHTFDLSGNINPAPRLGSYSSNLAGTGNKMVVINRSGNVYAFIAENSTTTQMEVFNVTDPKNPLKIAQYQAGNNQPGISVAVDSSNTYVYLVTSYAAGNKDFFIFDASTLPGSLTFKGSYDTSQSGVGSMTPQGVGSATGNRVIVVGTGGSYQYLVLDVSAPTAPQICSSSPISALAVTGGAFDITTVLQNDGFAYAYVVTGDTHNELKMILGGAGGEFSASGTYESPVLNSNYVTAFNSFTADVAQPSNTSIGIQVGVATDGGGVCPTASSSYTYLGPGKTSASTDLFKIGSNPSIIQASIPVLTSGNYANPGQCFRYKLWLTSSSSSATPVLYDFTVNYSP